jgi:hypothetical protein
VKVRQADGITAKKLSAALAALSEAFTGEQAELEAELTDATSDQLRLVTNLCEIEEKGSKQRFSFYQTLRATMCEYFHESEKALFVCLVVNSRGYDNLCKSIVTRGLFWTRSDDLELDPTDPMKLNSFQ